MPKHKKATKTIAVFLLMVYAKRAIVLITYCSTIVNT